MSAVTVREVTSADIDALVEFDATLFADDAWPATTWWAELAERPRREYLVLEQDGALLAYGGVDHGGESADIMTVAVVREAQGRGHGAAMLDALEEAAGRRGATGALLEVRADNAPARTLYERNDYQVLSTRPRYYQPGNIDALVMRKEVGNERE
jgi:ribosomal-protein-alanine N-acetyltransferase